MFCQSLPSLSNLRHHPARVLPAARIMMRTPEPPMLTAPVNRNKFVLVRRWMVRAQWP